MTWKLGLFIVWCTLVGLLLAFLIGSLIVEAVQRWRMHDALMKADEELRRIRERALREMLKVAFPTERRTGRWRSR